MIKLDDWAEIRHLHSTGKHSKREIARLVGVSRGTVDRARCGCCSRRRQRCRPQPPPSGWAGRGLRRCSGPRSPSCGRSMRCRIPRIGWCTRTGSRSNVISEYLRVWGPLNIVFGGRWYCLVVPGCRAVGGQ
ncbi:hypothetical protein E3T40_03640 [Cryobacterium sp. TMT1-19]|uniref:helix-turn-helix domain-containing protein n=1 Tax=Cryobacterium sp. TMT1-19 TaxID=1259231 RepID=UPI00106A9F87|nr:hypothetical protein E3T40_03640 [Cryobacterium sp. TMT1-19]